MEGGRASHGVVRSPAGLVSRRACVTRGTRVARTLVVRAWPTAHVLVVCEPAGSCGCYGVGSRRHHHHARSPRRRVGGDVVVAQLGDDTAVQVVSDGRHATSSPMETGRHEHVGAVAVPHAIPGSWWRGRGALVPVTWRRGWVGTRGWLARTVRHCCVAWPCIDRRPPWPWCRWVRVVLVHPRAEQVARRRNLEKARPGSWVRCCRHVGSSSASYRK